MKTVLELLKIDVREVTIADNMAAIIKPRAPTNKPVRSTKIYIYVHVFSVHASITSDHYAMYALYVHSGFRRKQKAYK